MAVAEATVPLAIAFKRTIHHPHQKIHLFTMPDILTGYELVFLIDVALSLLAGFSIGAERESRGKDAGISTHSLVITGAMLFTFLSMRVDPSSQSRIAAQVVTGIGFLGAGLILKEGATVRNLPLRQVYGLQEQ